MKSQVKILLIFLIVLAGVITYAIATRNTDTPSALKAISLGEDDEVAEEPTVQAETDSQAVAEPVRVSQEPDTAKHNILLIGESFVEGLSRPFADYCAANGHEYNSVCWYSSTTRHWAETDTLQFFLNKFNPDYVFVTIGGNEQFVKDLDKRERYIRRILEVIGGRKVVWLGTPAWKTDNGFNDLTQRVLGNDRYHDSRSLKLPRKRDHAHPTAEASVTWMSEAAKWIQSPQCRYPIVLKPSNVHVKSKHLTLLQPMEL